MGCVSLGERGVPDSHNVVDETVVERAVRGDYRGKYTIAERREVALYLWNRGLSSKMIEQMTGISDRTVHRILQRERLTELDRKKHPKNWNQRDNK